MPPPSTRIRPRGVVRTAIVAAPEAACVDVDGVDAFDPYPPELLALDPLEVPADVLPDAFVEPPQPAARRAAARPARADAGAMRGRFMGLPPGPCFLRKYGPAGGFGCRSGAA
jgi:hypothetical protein